MKEERIRAAIGLGAATVISVLFVLGFAAVIKIFSIESGVIRPVNQVFKIIAIVAGILIGVRGDKRIIKGVVFGAVYSIVVNLIFSVVSKTAFFSLRLIFDVLFCSVIGLIGGVISATAKR